MDIMITVVLQGGLGNQLFQYAYGRSLMKKGKDVVFDVSFFKKNTQYTKREYLLDKFLISDAIVTVETSPKQTLFKKIINKIDVTRRVRYVPANLSQDAYLADGYYTTEKYFSDIRETLLAEVILREPGSLYKEWEKKIVEAKNPIVVHARRLDFINSGFVNLDTSYYENALNYFEKDSTIFAFSDDIAWLTGVLNRPVVAVSGQGLKDYEEMMLMSKSNNFIIANSTFSWWGAWLSQAVDKKVVAPKQWFKSMFWRQADKDTVPENWIRI